MSWLAIPVGAALGALIQSPLFWLAAVIALVGWRAWRRQA